MWSEDPKCRRLRHDRWFCHPARARWYEARMKCDMRLRAEMVYDIDPGIPRQLEVLLKAKGEAGVIYVS